MYMHTYPVVHMVHGVSALLFVVEFGLASIKVSVNYLRVTVICFAQTYGRNLLMYVP